LVGNYLLTLLLNQRNKAYTTTLATITNKTLKIILIVLVSIFSIFQIGKWTGLLKSYTVTTSSSEPTLKVGNHFITTNLIKPERLDFITFKHHFQNEFMNGEYELVFRLCGIERDTVEIKSGILFVNGINIDKKLKLKYPFLFQRKDIEKISNKIDLYEYHLNFISNDSVIAQLTEDEALKLGRKYSERIIESKIEPEIEKVYNENWNIDNFGPIVIPKDYLFVLGDNRSGSLDSRYLGLINIDKLNGTVIYK
jgi:signal peptidase I